MGIGVRSFQDWPYLLRKRSLSGPCVPKVPGVTLGAYNYCLLKPRLLAAPWRGQGTVLELILVVKAGNKSLRGRVDNGNKHWRSWSVQLPSLPAFHFLNEKRVPSGAS